MDTFSRLRFLFAKFLQRQCSPDEVEELAILLQQVEAEEALTEEMQLLWEEVRKNKIQHPVDWDKMYTSAISSGGQVDMIIKQAASRIRWPYYVIAVISIFIIAAPVYWFARHPLFKNACNAFSAVDKSGGPYYFNNNGNDSSDGSQSNPWKTINKLNIVQLKPGDTVYFEGGQAFNGSILIDSADAGSQDSPIVITSTGKRKALIDGGAAMAMQVDRTKFITISQLSFQGAGRNTGNTKDGLILNKSSHVVVDSVDVKGFQKSGLLVNSCSDIEVKRVYALENGFAGIYVTGEWQKRDCSNIHISYCTAENNPGDPSNLTNHSGNGILAGLCKNVLIEYSSATNNGWDMPRTGNGPVGIWCYEADRVIIQHCISYKNKTSPGARDGGGFDIDGGVTNSVIQYCLSYENQGSGFGIFQYAGASNWYNNTIRYCISENDGSMSPAQAGVFIWNGSRDTNQFKNCYFYNNVVYNTKGAAIHYEADSKNAGFQFYNNIFVAKDLLVIGKETNGIYRGNNWYSLKSGFNIGGMKDFKTWANKNNKEKLNGTIAGFNLDPLFKNAGMATMVMPSQLDSFVNYQVPAKSILRTNGLDLQQLFGIADGDKSFNQMAAPKKGIGACF
ncbi:MAG: hypothetical protein JWM28_349 [Chitinophagaceae bacterium]|nr:hypothetical protein [Chitinophagaceae bacterium]